MPALAVVAGVGAGEGGGAAGACAACVFRGGAICFGWSVTVGLIICAIKPAPITPIMPATRPAPTTITNATGAIQPNSPTISATST